MFRFFSVGFDALQPAHDGPQSMIDYRKARMALKTDRRALTALQ